MTSQSMMVSVINTETAETAEHAEKFLLCDLCALRG
jgi:hypothetical protein